MCFAVASALMHAEWPVTRDPTRRDLTGRPGRPSGACCRAPSGGHQHSSHGCRVFRPFCFNFSNIHLSAIINADTDSLENAKYHPTDKLVGLHREPEPAPEPESLLSADFSQSFTSTQSGVDRNSSIVSSIVISGEKLMFLQKRWREIVSHQVIS